MRKASMILVFIVGAGLAMASAQPNAPVCAGKAPDSMQAGKMCPGMVGKGFGIHQGPWAGMRQDGPAACCPGFNPMFQNGPGWRSHGPFGMRPHHMFMARKMFKAAILGMVLVNVLLTILVGLDMAKRSRFNGLWIAILLIAGIPGSAVYALFRIGDSIAEVKKN